MNNNEPKPIETTSAAIAANPLLSDALSIEAKFMGWRFIKWCGDDEDKIPMYQRFENDVCVHPGIFHSPKYEDWNGIMTIVEKIENLGVAVTIRSNFVLLNGWIANNPNTTTKYEWNGGYTSDSKKLSVYYGIVEFIKWYNQQSVSEGIR